MKLKRFLLIFSTVLFGISVKLVAQPVPYPEGATGELEPFVHDPVIAEEDGVFYMFHTGPGITAWKSHDLQHWDSLPSVFPEIPDYMGETIPGFSGHLWAPDIYHHNDTWFLYYSVSAFGKNTSFMGVATSPTLDPDSEDYKWTDHGLILQSFPGLNDWNAIDPNIIEDELGVAWMAFGSFWSGLKLVELADNRIELADKDNPDIISIASRKSPTKSFPEGGHSVDAGNGAIEGPFIIERGGFYYLFASIDYCCRGANSTYKMIVGRSDNVKGPYVDRDGVPLMEGGGTILLTGDDRWYGVGHNGVLRTKDTDYLVYHAYDSQNAHAWARLQIKPIVWDGNWPTVTVSDESED